MFNLLRGDASYKIPRGAEGREGSDTTAFGHEECEIFVKSSGRGLTLLPTVVKVCLVTESLP